MNRWQKEARFTNILMGIALALSLTAGGIWIMTDSIATPVQYSRDVKGETS
jgi:hypothetical protein